MAIETKTTAAATKAAAADLPALAAEKPYVPDENVKALQEQEGKPTAEQKRIAELEALLKARETENAELADQLADRVLETQIGTGLPVLRIKGRRAEALVRRFSLGEKSHVDIRLLEQDEELADAVLAIKGQQLFRFVD